MPDLLFATRFPVQIREWVRARFAAAIAQGASTPDATVRTLLAAAECSQHDDVRWRQLRDAMLAAPAEAVAFAVTVAWYANLSPQLKLSMEKAVNQPMEPPTTKQLDTLEALGYYELPISRDEATSLIRSLKSPAQ